VKRLPLRVRLTVAFAVAMAVVLAVLGAFLYVRVRGTLDEQIDQSLRSRAQTAAIARAGPRVGDDEGFVQVLGEGATGLLSRQEVERARRESFFAERASMRDVEGPVRLFVTEENGAVVVAGASLEDRDEAVSALLTQLAIGGPIALVLASSPASRSQGRRFARWRRCGKAPRRSRPASTATAFPNRRATTRSPASRARSTRCSHGSRRDSSESGDSSPRPATSCERRWPR
jgi:hypothetical protein